MKDEQQTALDDIVSARCATYGPLNKLIVKMMVMDVLYAHFRKQIAQEAICPQLDPAMQTWSMELAARTQAMMDTHGIARQRQKEMGEKAKGIAAEMEQRFYTNLVATSNTINGG